MDGWAAPGAGIRVELLLPDGPRNTYADEDGRFVFEAVPCGLAKFALHVPRDSEFSTVLSPTIGCSAGPELYVPSKSATADRCTAVLRRSERQA